MFGVDYGADSAQFLSLGDDMDCESGLTGRFRTIDLCDTAARHASHAEGVVKTERTGRDGFNILDSLITETHHGACTEIFLKMLHGHSKSLALLLKVGDA